MNVGFAAQIFAIYQRAVAVEENTADGYHWASLFMADGKLVLPSSEINQRPV
ncbi:hypothetical protein HMPREF0454_03113 [Hafnia alvei ATCC 51873]|uniref:Uncharacterized protein n=1 Tax=Hafnia alvei ATCC 51873 TaxID=1002364 RepID=G9Y9E5_HAFAL|nr:hypothetical protein HMPREF0454_03113 [Hafnia alvei ATCC 51873]